MKTWFNVLPMAIIPVILLIVPSFVPHVDVLNKSIDGLVYRAYFLDRLLLPLLTADSSWLLVNWFQGSHATKQILLHCLIVANLAVITAPIVYAFGAVFLRLHNWTVITEMKQKRHAAK